MIQYLLNTDLLKIFALSDLFDVLEQYNYRI